MCQIPINLPVIKTILLDPLLFRKKYKFWRISPICKFQFEPPQNTGSEVMAIFKSMNWNFKPIIFFLFVRISTGIWTEVDLKKHTWGHVSIPLDKTMWRNWGCFNKSQGHLAAWAVEHATLDLEVMSGSSRTLLESTKKRYFKKTQL